MGIAKSRERVFFYFYFALGIGGGTCRAFLLPVSAMFSAGAERGVAVKQTINAVDVHAKWRYF